LRMYFVQLRIATSMAQSPNIHWQNNVAVRAEAL